MPFSVPSALVERDSHRPNKFTAEASTLRFPVGRWPQTVTVGLSEFGLTRLDRDADGDIMIAHYLDRRSGAVLDVFND